VPGAFAGTFGPLLGPEPDSSRLAAIEAPLVPTRKPAPAPTQQAASALKVIATASLPAPALAADMNQSRAAGAGIRADTSARSSAAGSVPAPVRRPVISDSMSFDSPPSKVNARQKHWQALDRRDHEIAPPLSGDQFARYEL